jgi:long-chain acyl-CoA synthetase
MNLYESFASVAQKNAGRTAVIDGDKTYKYADLLRAVEGMAAVAAASTKQEAVGVFLPTSAAFVISYYGLLRAGFGVMPINLLAPPRDIAFSLKDSGVDTIITSEKLLPNLKDLGTKFIVVEELAKAAAAGKTPPMAALKGRPVAKDESLATLLYTSGTTGTPKGVRLTHKNILTNIEDCLKIVDMHPEDVTIGILPLFHTFAVTVTMGVPMHSGGTFVTHMKFNPDAALKDIEQHKVSLLVAIPSMFRVLNMTKTLKPYNTSSIKFAIAGGEPLPPKIGREFGEIFKQDLLEGYGLTEAAPVVCVNPPGKNRPGTAGKALQRVKVRMVDDACKDVPVGQVGEILVQGPNVMQGYHNRPDETANVIRNGWLHTGDMGRIDKDGYIAVTGRKKEMLKVGGECVFPCEVEAVLEEHPMVLQAAVISMKDEKRGEAVKAIVVPKDASANADAIKEYCKQHLAPYKVPKVIEFRSDVPRNATGKILKRAL